MRDVVREALAFVQNYPDKRRYWELSAQEGAMKLLADNATFADLTLKIVIHPDEQRSHVRTASAPASSR